MQTELLRAPAEQDAPRRARIARAPLALDLDGTLLRTDALMETLVAFLRRRPLGVLQVLGWLLRGRAHLKARLAEYADPDVALWPVNDGLALYATLEAAAGRTIVLATAADETIAARVRDRFPFITEALASDGETNLKGAAKAKALAHRFPDGFVYAGDAQSDLKVWAQARAGVFAGASEPLEARVEALTPLEAVFPRESATGRVWLHALRVHQWAKNALLFVPLLLGGKAGDPAAWGACLLAFLGMGVLASASYLLNDLIDLEDDRRHWAKRLRPLASGALPIQSALIAAPLGMAGGLALGFLAGGWAGAAALCAYLALTLAYSGGLKRVAILDSVTLAALFTLRLGVGIAVAAVAPSPWLLVFSMFLFTSLSLAKRATEIQQMTAHGHAKALGRGYLACDLPVVTGFGIASATAGVLILVLYLIEEAFAKAFYAAPSLLWALPPALALWLGRVWLVCGRGELADDPVAFALKDRISLTLAAGMGAAFLAAIALPLA